MTLAVTDENVAPNNNDTDVVMEESTNVENRYMKTDSSSMAVSSEQKQNKAVVFSPELLGMYYSRLFPYHFLHDWLSYDPSSTGSGKLFSRREFSFTIEPSPGDEIYIRYQSFSSQEELTAAIIKRRPHKIDIGAVFSHPPKDHKALQGKFHTEQRELVFDIDLTDYDDIRTCGCSGAKICTKCWTYMTMAIKVMEKGLREDFGFRHIAWFYSGRRGVHAWICDESARTLTNEARNALATYFEIPLGSEKNNKGLSHPLHPMLSRSFEALEPMFIKHVLPASGHGLLAVPEHWNNLLATLPEAANPVRERMEKQWNSKNDDMTPMEKWQDLKRHLSLFIGKGKNGKSPKNVTSADRVKIESWPCEVVFRQTYPRLDINVSKMQNHLLKSPFCIHPKTGRVCVPMDTNKIQHFDPFSVPTLTQLMREIDEYEQDETNEKVAHDWQKTSLKEPFEHFQRHFLEPLWKELRKEQRETEEQKAATTGEGW